MQGLEGQGNSRRRSRNTEQNSKGTTNVHQQTCTSRWARNGKEQRASSASQSALGDKAVSQKGGFGERTLVPVFVPGEHPPKPPFWKPPFCQHQKGSLGDKRAVSKRVVFFWRSSEIPSRPRSSQKNSLQRKIFGTIDFVKITKQSLRKANSFACSLANRNKPVAATLQRKCSGETIL